MTTWRIGPCAVDTSSREVQVAGQRRALPPKAFALLTLLLQHRHRIVSKDEIVRDIWHGAVLSDSVLARTVMLVRRAIAEDATAPSPIRNLHGQGYRFVGEVLEERSATLSDERHSPAPSPLTPGRIGVLPCRNESGDPQLDWTRYGLMALVGDALAKAGVSAAPMSTVLQFDAQLDTALLHDERARRTIEGLGLDYAAQASIRSQGGALWLDYRIYGRGGQVSMRSLRDASATALGERFAQEAAQILQAPSANAVLFPSTDPFVNEALGRANEFMAQELWTDAEALFCAISRLVPHDLEVKLRRLACLCAVVDLRGLGLGQTLLDHPCVKADASLRGRVHYALGRTLYMGGPTDARSRAERHLSDAMRLVPGHEQEDWAIRLLYFAACVRLERGEYDQAQPLVQQAARAAERAGHGGLHAMTQQALGLLDTVTGDLLLAQQRFETLADLHQRQRRITSAAHCLSWQALCTLELGLIDAAEAQVDRMLDLLVGSDANEVVGPMLSAAALVLSERASPEQLSLVLSRFVGLDDSAAANLRSPYLATRGVWHLCRGEAAQARRVLQEALTMARAYRSPLFMRPWGNLLLRLCMASGQWQDAKAMRKLLAELPGHARDPMLQGSLLHAQACDAWRQGRRRASMVMLTQLIEEYPMTRAQAAARIDLAWLLIADGELQRAERILSGGSAWRQQHASGLTAQAQLHFAKGAYDEAAQLHQHALARHQGAVPAWQVALGQAYQAAALAPPGASDKPLALPQLPLWVSLSWLPQ